MTALATITENDGDIEKVGWPQLAVVDGVDVDAHGALHERAGADEIDGDHLDIDFTPLHYTPTTDPAEADDADDLAAHLAGIEDAVAPVKVHIDDSNQVTNTTDETDFDNTHSLLANEIVSGTSIDFAIACAVNTGFSTVTLRLRLYVNDGSGDTLLYDTLAKTIGSGLSNHPASVRGIGVCRTGGASGDMNVTVTGANLGAVIVYSGPSLPTGIDWTAATTFRVSAQWGTASNQNAIVMRLFRLRREN